MDSGNGKMTHPGNGSAALEGQRGFVFLSGDMTDLDKAIDWLRQGGDFGRHMPGCQCQRCIPARALAREAARVSDCTCGWCWVCWVKEQMAQGRL